MCKRLSNVRYAAKGRRKFAPILTTSRSRSGWVGSYAQAQVYRTLTLTSIVRYLAQIESRRIGRVHLPRTTASIYKCSPPGHGRIRNRSINMCQYWQVRPFKGSSLSLFLGPIHPTQNVLARYAPPSARRRIDLRKTRPTLSKEWTTLVSAAQTWLAQLLTKLKVTLCGMQARSQLPLLCT